MLEQVKPPTLFVSGDGPKPDPTEKAQVQAVRSFIQQNLSWRCDAYFNFYPENQGLYYGVSGGISWFFEAVEEGIILEDDTLPHPDFFLYATQLLERYREEPRVGSISGDQLLPGWSFSAGYDFIRIPLIWGWATWRRVWQRYDRDMKLWPQAQAENFPFTALSGNPRLARHLRDRFAHVYRHKSTWDYQLTFSLLREGLLTVVPARNLVRNIGIRHSLGHNTRRQRPWQKLPLEGWQDTDPPPALAPNLPYERALTYYMIFPPLWVKAWYRMGGDYPYLYCPFLRRV